MERLLNLYSINGDKTVVVYFSEITTVVFSIFLR